MQGIVLVGGEGTRLRPLTYDVPKPMLPIVEIPVISRVVEWLGLHGVTRAVLSLGYQPEPFLAAFPGGAWAGVEISYAVEPHPLDTAGAVLFAAETAGMLDEPVLVFNGDVLTDLDLGALVELHKDRGAAITIAPDAGRGSFALRGGGPRRDGARARVRREAAAGRGPLEPHQRGQLRLRTPRPRLDRPRQNRLG